MTTEEQKTSRINKKASIQNILDCVSKGLGRPVSLSKFIALLEQEGWEKCLRDASALFGTKIVYR